MQSYPACKELYFLAFLSDAARFILPQGNVIKIFILLIKTSCTSVLISRV